MYKLITDGKLLDKEITATGTLYASAHKRLHAAAVSAIAFAARTGQVGPLNRLYGFLKTNDQSALTAYIRRAHAIVGLEGDIPDGKEKAVVQAAIEAGAVFGFADKQFTIKRGHTTAEAKALTKLCADRFINPDGKRDREVFDRNVLSEIAVLNDQDALSRLVKLGKEITSGNTDRRTIKVSDKVARFIGDAAGKAEVMLNQLSLTETSPVASSDTAPAKRKAAAKRSKAKAVPARKAAITAKQAEVAATSNVETVN